MASAYYYSDGNWIKYASAAPSEIDPQSGSFAYTSLATGKRTTAKGAPAIFETLGIRNRHPSPAALYFKRLPGAGGPSLWAIIPGQATPAQLDPVARRPSAAPVGIAAATIAAIQVLGPRGRFL